MFNNRREHFVVVNPLFLSISFSNQSSFEPHIIFSCRSSFLCVEPFAPNLFLAFRKLYQIPSLILVKRSHLLIDSLLSFTTLKCAYSFFIGGWNIFFNNWKCISYSIKKSSWFSNFLLGSSHYNGLCQL